MFLEISQNALETICARVSFLIKLRAEACDFIKKETLAQVFSCEFSEISKNTFFTEYLWATASVTYFDKVLNLTLWYLTPKIPILDVTGYKHIFEFITKKTKLSLKFN